MVDVREHLPYKQVKSKDTGTNKTNSLQEGDVKR